MKKTVFIGALTVAGLAAGAAAAGTMDDVKTRGKLNCGVTTGLVGFAAPDASGEWKGFDVAVCRAVAAAVLGDPAAVEFVPTTGKTRFTALASGEVDLLARNTTWTFSRDVDLKFTFVGVNYYDGQGFMVPKELGVSSDILDAPPTDGLWGDDRTDEDQIGASYPELEWAMAFDGDEAGLTARQQEVLAIYRRLHKANLHKMNPIPVCKLPDSGN